MKVFQCQDCGYQTKKWQGRCPECSGWNSFIEEVVPDKKSRSNIASPGNIDGLEAKTLDQVKKQQSTQKRISTGIKDVDQVFGGGIVPGSLTIISGEPGIGKSTLLLQIAANIDSNGSNILYTSGEESEEQIALRAKRLNVDAKSLRLAATRSSESIAAAVAGGGYDVVIIDSVQTLSIERLVSAPGTVSQIVASLHLVAQAAKKSGTAVILVGQVTKSGVMAGPKVLEHLVDVVINFNGEVNSELKVFSAIKNRFGSTDEAAIMSMTSGGLVSKDDTSESLLAQRNEVDGSVLLMTIIGNRPVVSEVQALTAKSNFGYPKRTASGFDANRLNILIAILGGRTNVDLSDYDVFVNIAGGLKIDDPAADLAICMALSSSISGITIAPDAVVFGEVGLGGEIRRSAKFAEKRTQEAKRLGFKTVIGPEGAGKGSKRYTLLRKALNDNIKKARK